MTRRTTTMFLVVALQLLCRTAAAQEFDMTRPTTMKGKLAGFAVEPGKPSYILLEVTDARGKSEVWAIQGNPFGTLMNDGWNLKLPLGEELSIVTFRLKVGANAADALSTNADDTVVATIKAGRLLRGTEVTMSNGTKKRFG